MQPLIETHEKYCTIWMQFEIIAMALIKHLRQGLEGYSQGPQFDQNMVRDSEKRKFYRRDSGIDCSPGSEIPQNLRTGCVIFCLSVENLGNLHGPNKSTSCEREAAR